MEIEGAVAEGGGAVAEGGGPPQIQRPTRGYIMKFALIDCGYLSFVSGLVVLTIALSVKSDFNPAFYVLIWVGVSILILIGVLIMVFHCIHRLRRVVPLQDPNQQSQAPQDQQPQQEQQQ